MKDAFRRADELSTEKSPYGTLMYPYLWRTYSETMSIRLEMGRTEPGLGPSRRIITVFIFQPLGLGQGTGVKVHVSVWLLDDSKQETGGLEAKHSMNTNYHTAALSYFKSVLLGAPGTAFAIIVPEELPPSPDEALPPPPPEPHS